jgi:hypothetical protein
VGWIGILLGIVGALFAAMMAVPRDIAAHNVVTYFQGLGLGGVFGVTLGASVTVAGIILAVVSWRNKYRGKRARREVSSSAATGRAEGGAAIRIGRAEGGKIQGVKGFGFKDGIVVDEEKDLEIRDSEFRGPRSR